MLGVYDTRCRLQDAWCMVPAFADATADGQGE